MNLRICTLASFLLAVVPAVVAAGPSDRTAPRLLETVEVRSAGPVIRKYTRGSKTLWVLGVVGPLPKRIAFQEAGIRRRIAESGAVLGPPGLTLGHDAGMFRMLMLWPAIRRQQFNPDGATLASVLPEEGYKHWQDARARHLGSATSVERLRPMYAAHRLYRAALETSALSEKDVVDEVVQEEARGHRIPVVDARAQLRITNTKKAVGDFDVASDDDAACLNDTLTRLEAWLATTQPLADAWSIGDIDKVREVRSPNPVRACWATLTNDAIARSEGIEDLDAHIREAWRAALRQSIGAHDVVFTTISLRDMVDDTGYAELLAAEGFVVE